ncbi:hypothetical protein [uncultured Dialister sp.]|nr:hypothetical protein [uncultured Dialister sp.]
MKGRYDIILEPRDERLVETMCNLSEGVFERGMERGMKQGIELERKRKNLEIAKNFLLAGVSEDTVASCAGLSKDEVKKLKEEIEG